MTYRRQGFATYHVLKHMVYNVVLMYQAEWFVPHHPLALLNIYEPPRNKYKDKRSGDLIGLMGRARPERRQENAQQQRSTSPP